MQTLKFSRAVSGKTLKNFEDNIIRQKGVDFCIKYLEENAYSSTIVTCAFDWMDTPEGAYYWRDVDRAWLKYLNALTIS